MHTVTTQPRTFQSDALADRPGNKAQALRKPAHNPVWSRLAFGIQPRLTVNAQGDVLEQEADRVADQVLRIPGPAHRGDEPSSLALRTPMAQRKCADGAEADVEQQVRGNAGDAPAAVPPFARAGSGSPGEPLDPTARTWFESRFGRDFSAVRIHTDERAAASARALGALAYAAGPHIAFADGQYRTNTDTGRRLLAHELTHVIQQQAAGAPRLQRQPRRSEPKPPPKPQVPANLLAAVDLTKMSRDALIKRHDDMARWYAKKGLSKDENKALKAGIAEIGGELSQRALAATGGFSDKAIPKMKRGDLVSGDDELSAWYAVKGLEAKANKALKGRITSVRAELAERALQAGRTFSPQAAAKMKAYFVETLEKRRTVTDNEGQAAAERQFACINVLRAGMTELFGDKTGLTMTKNNTMEETMEQLAKAGRASSAHVIKYASVKGTVIGSGSGLRPDHPETSIWDHLMGEVKGRAIASDN
ncbi:DUF4157 domain-containing protein [uncultured Thiodictyon sp.]|jgi:hypothetical protein|uniref:eCIS core domain-containing protein n=1 Tax=uncultured Thiodictyon sp. TaxID=1846217 RepID=UPI0025E94FD3|nr:DUF4157 domain-containing protein [uncultured Thiodictyon sp.]